MPNSVRRARTCALALAPMPNRPIATAMPSSRYVTANVRSNVCSDSRRISPGSPIMTSSSRPSAARTRAAIASVDVPGSSQSATVAARVSPVSAM